MRVAVSGSHGLIGSALLCMLESRGDEVFRLQRSASSSPREIYWNPSDGQVDTERLEGLDAIIHLAGENVGKKRWSPAVKARIWESRVGGTEFLAASLLSLKRPPRVLVSASAIGYYGNTGDKLVNESDAPGTSFLARLCVEWESKSQIAASSGIRVVNPRLGVVLAPSGGALARMLPFFRCGLGGKIGNGKAWMSWITLGDVVSALVYCIHCEELHGPVNLTAPFPVTNTDFTHVLGRILHRPAIFPMPALGIRLVFGEMGQELLLNSTKAVPERLDSSGFRFETPNLGDALADLLSKRTM